MSGIGGADDDWMIYWVGHCSASGQEPEAPLTDEGHAQARGLIDVLASLGVSRIVSSPYLRAVQSVQPFAGRVGLAIETDSRLRERVLPTTTLVDWQAALRRTVEDEDFAAPGGENLRVAADCAVAAFEDIVREERVTAIVSHGNLTALLWRRLGHPMDFEAAMRLTNPDVFRIHPLAIVWTSPTSGLEFT
jgi:2,3-bisphosphoglycerate-dependent phosphoglycerate mutase